MKETKKVEMFWPENALTLGAMSKVCAQTLHLINWMNLVLSNLNFARSQTLMTAVCDTLLEAAKF